LTGVKGSLAAILAASLLGGVVLAGCGGSHGDDTTGQALTVPAYGPFPAMTVPVAPGRAEECRREADAISRAAKGFLIPYPSDADNYRVLAQVQFTAFKANLCDTAILREAVARRLTRKELREVLRFFGFLGGTAQELLQASER
jgi:hypothetical protein